MNAEESLLCLERLRTAFALFDAGFDMKRCQLKRQHPDASETQIETLLTDWLFDDRREESGFFPGLP